MEPLKLDVSVEGEEVSIRACLSPEVQCFCLEHEWYLRIEGPVGFSQEWSWRSQHDAEGYRAHAMKWKPPVKGRYKIIVELANHGFRVEKSFSLKPKILVAYYSRTGVTKTLATELAESLGKAGAEVEVREIRVKKEYSRPLHLNPRLIFETFAGRADILVDFNPCACDALILASPIWAGRPAAPMTAFLKSIPESCKGRPVACFTTSALSVDYSVRLAKLAEKAGLRVVYRANAPFGQLKLDTSELLKALQT